MKKILIYILFLFGCFSCSRKEFTKKYCVISSFNEIILETDDKLEAYETAHNLTMMGRVFSSKPNYFVLEKEPSLIKDF